MARAPCLASILEGGRNGRNFHYRVRGGTGGVPHVEEEVMAYSEAMRRAQAEYRRKNVKQISVRFYPDTAELYEWAKAQGNAQAYIRDLIRADMETRRDASSSAADSGQV